MKKRIIALILCFTIIFSMTSVLPVMAGEQFDEGSNDTQAQTVALTLSDLKSISKYGNISFDGNLKELMDAGYEYGDLVDVNFLGKTITMPLCDNYSGVDSGQPTLIAGETYLNLAMNMGNFAEYYGIATEIVNPDKTLYWTVNEGVILPVTFTITMKEKGGYYEEYILHKLTYSENREDYPYLTDVEFANFRNVDTTGMGKNILYRSSSTVNPKHNRNTYADNAIREAGVTVIMNLSDSADLIKNYYGYENSYYSTVKTIELNLGIDMSSSDFKQGLRDGLRFFAQNPGVYEVQCIIGKDRTGTVCALLEALMGASADEIVEDYMISYYNFYAITKDDSRYQTIANSNIMKELQNAFGIENIYNANLQKCAEDYIRSIGLSNEEITSLKKNLSVNNVKDQPEVSSEKKLSPKIGDQDILLICAFLMLPACACTGVVLIKRKE